MAASNLTLVLPPLLFSDHEHSQFIALLNENAKSLSNLRRVFSRCRPQSFAAQEIILAELFGLPYSAIEELPLAAITAIGSGFDAATGYWFYADPVHLHPDLDHVLLFDRDTFELSKSELGQLIEELQELFEESGLAVHFGKQDKLFIRIDDKPEVAFSPLSAVSGKNILQHLPEGKNAAQWRLLQNEIQMQMTQSVVNQRREESGAVAVNGLWFWGCGYLLRGRHARFYDVVTTEQLFVTGLANMTDAIVEKHQNGFDAIDLDKTTLMTIDGFVSSPAAGVNMLIEFEQRWLKPGLAAVRNGSLDSITLVAGKSKTNITKKQLKRFWKRDVRIETLASLLS